MRRLLVYHILVVLALLILTACATTPPPRQSVGNLSAEQLKGLLDRGEGLFLVDTRTEYEFKQGHIPRSINIPPHKFRVIGEMLPVNKNAHLVFYCRGSA